MRTVDSWPILLVFVLIVLLTMVAIEVGFLIGQKTRKEDGLDKYPIENSASGIVLGLLAFILAFAFGVVASRYAEMREVAREDTDAIEDLYLMADFLPEEPAGKVRSLLHDYHRTRLDAIRSQDREKLAVAITRSDEIQDEIWKIVVTARKADNSSLLNQLVASVHEMMDTHAIRVHKGLNTRLPMAIWWTTGGLLILSSLLLGLSSGLHGKRSRLASGIVTLCFAAVIVMIIDLDRPFRTLFARSEDPTARVLLERMEAEAN
jgi:hypothetical protein